MILMHKFIKWGNQQSITGCRRHCTTEKFHILQKGPMASIKLFADHFYIRHICFNDNPAKEIIYKESENCCKTETTPWKIKNICTIVVQAANNFCSSCECIKKNSRAYTDRC